MKKIYTLLALAITSFGFAQYNGTGNFSLVNEINNLTDGYYVITNETSQFLMTSTVTTTGTIFYIHAPVTVESGTITDPLAANVWKIETTAEGKTIYSETTQKYVGWTSGNSATAESTVGTSNTWTFSLVAASGSQPTRISTKLVATPTRQLSYNSNSPRFAVYNNSDQQELQFYKLEVAEEEAPATASFNSELLTNFTYVENQGPSLPQTISVLISDLPGEETATLALDSTDFTIVSPTNLALGNGTHSIQLQLKNNLTVNTYNANLTLTHNSNQLAALELTGEVTGIPVVISDNLNITELNYVEGQGPSTGQSFNISGNHLDGTDVILTATSDFEISIDNTTFGTSVTLEEFDGTSTLIYTRLVNELAVDTYTGNITVTGGGLTENFLISLSGEVTEETASIVENNIEGLKVYPNPASELVNITSNEIGTKNVTIFNMLGKKVLETSTEETVNVSTLTSGVYIMNITQDGKKASRKLVIK